MTKNQLALQESIITLISEKPIQSMAAADQCWFDDSCILDMDYFVKTISGIKAKGVRPDLIGSIIAHYASKWLPELSTEKGSTDCTSAAASFASPAESTTVTASWMKKRFFVETLVGILPPDRDSVPCNFLLRLLRTANMVGVEPNYREEVEKRVSWQLDGASLKELMIPSFSHTCGSTLLDVELVIRLVKRFAASCLDEGAKNSGVASLVKVAKLVDAYLAEAALDVDLGLDVFIELAAALPSHARAMDDGLYRAIDTYLKAHPGVTKQDRKVLCRLIDCRKLSPEASVHAAQNERLPVRAVIQVLFSEQTKMNRQLDWSGSFSGTIRGSPNPNPGMLDAPARCHSKREMNAQQIEIKKLREEVMRVQSQCVAMQTQMEKLIILADNKKKGFFFRWRLPSFKSSSTVSVFEKNNTEEGEVSFSRQMTPMPMPMDVKPKLVRGRTPPPKYRRKSMS